MEEQVLHWLQATTTPDTTVIRNAEQQLLNLYPQPDFPLALLTIATHSNVDTGSRKAALTALRSYVGATWSPQLDETFTGSVYLGDDAKSRIRNQVLSICTSADATNDVTTQSLAASVVSRIASVDFPDQWPTLFPELVNILNTVPDDPPAHGALRVLLELVDSGLSEDHFFAVAHDLVNALQYVATNGTHSTIVQAMAINVLRSCFEMLEQVLETDNAPAVRAFLDESLKQWISFFMHSLKQPLPEAHEDVQNVWRGPFALKIQIVKMLEKVKRVYVTALSPHVLELFTIVWEELSRLAPAYAELFIDGDTEGKLVDSDGLPYTLDALVLEEIDFLASALKSKTVRTELQNQMKQLPNAEHTVGWLQELIRVLVQYSRIPQEEEGLWQFDANIYLCETTSITANYTPRAACAELVVRSLMEWLKQLPLKALLHFNDQSLVAQNASWKEREAMLYLINQAVKDLDETQSLLEPDTTNSMLNQITPCTSHENMFMRAAAYLCLGAMFKVIPSSFVDSATTCITLAIRAATEDESDIVNVCCITTIPLHLEALPRDTTLALRDPIINTIQEFINKHDLRDELEDADDVKSALIVTLRDAVMLNTSNLSEGPGIDLFFTLASDGASNFQLSEMLVDAFQGIVSKVAEYGSDSYVHLCAKTIPSLSGAFDVASMTDESALTDLAAELVSALAEFGFDPLPDGFIAAIMPKLQRVLSEGTEASLLRPATSAVTHMLNKGATQLIAWTDGRGKPSMQVILEIVDRLLNSPDVEESAADQVGYLASSLVTKFGADKLGDYLMQLLRAVAVRLASAERAAFIQSLLMVFATLSVTHASSVIDFLSQFDIDSTNGLPVVLTKWLENSVNFAGFDEIRTNVVALSKIYSLQDPRVKNIHVKGDIIVEQTTRIKTRSRAKANPDRYTSIPADLKILKLLADELHNAATSRFSDLGAARAAVDALDEEDDINDDDDGDWEDVGDGGLDLSSERVKNELMGLVGEGRPSPTGSRARDDETADYLLNWFRSLAQNPGFEEQFSMLNQEEQEKLRELLS